MRIRGALTRNKCWLALGISNSGTQLNDKNCLTFAHHLIIVLIKVNLSGNRYLIFLIDTIHDAELQKATSNKYHQLSNWLYYCQIGNVQAIAHKSILHSQRIIIK